jgi:predicted nucleotidyltransferase
VALSIWRLTQRQRWSVQSSVPEKAQIMRLTPEQIDIIKSTAQSVLGEGAQVILFGSRVDDALKGGDIDLLMELDTRVPNKTLAIGQIYAQLIKKLGDRKIDILIKDPSTQPAAIFTVAQKTGVRL